MSLRPAPPLPCSTVMALSPSDLLPFSYLLIGKVGPRHVSGSDLNVGTATVSQAVLEATGGTRAQLHEGYRRAIYECFDDVIYDYYNLLCINDNNGVYRNMYLQRGRGARAAAPFAFPLFSPIRKIARAYFLSNNSQPGPRSFIAGARVTWATPRSTCGPGSVCWCPPAP